MKVSAIRCKKCDDIVWSRHRHDFRFCKCESVAIDGGRDYTKISGNQEDLEFLKDYEVDVTYRKKTDKEKEREFIQMMAYLSDRYDDV